MMAMAITILLIAFWFSQNPVIFWALLGTSILSFVVLKILVSKYVATHPYQGRRTKGYTTRRRRKKGSALVAVVSGVKQGYKKSARARNARHHNSGVRSSLIGLHRSKYKKHTFW